MHRHEIEVGKTYHNGWENGRRSERKVLEIKDGMVRFLMLRTPGLRIPYESTIKLVSFARWADNEVTEVE